MESIKIDQLYVAEGNRKNFDKTKFEELKESIREKGIITPLIVRPGDGEHSGPTCAHEVVAGARRLQAAKELGLKEIPIILKKLTDAEAAEVRVVDNLLREDLNPMDEARELERMTKEFGKKVSDIADNISKPVSYIKARLQLLSLPVEAQKRITEGSLSANHGLVLARIPDQKKQEKLLKRILDNKLSANAAENYLEKSGKDINEASFKTDECKKCPNLGKNQAGLFDKDTDIDSICLDGACWARKARECGKKGKTYKQAKKTYPEALYKAILEKLEPMTLTELEMIARAAGVDIAKVKESLKPKPETKLTAAEIKRGYDNSGKKISKPAPKPRNVLVTTAKVSGKDNQELSEEQKKAADALAGTFAGKK